MTPNSRRGRRAARAPIPQAPPRDRWLLSYADFVTLLLALFVVLYASARMDAATTKGMFEGLQAAFVPPIPISSGALPRDSDAQGAGPPPISPLARLETELADAIASVPRSHDESPGVSLARTERGVVVRLATTEFFPAGGVEIPAERRAVLDALAPLLVAMPGGLQFEGHTDARPVGPGPYPTNWELSAARAAAMARLFIDDHALEPSRVTIVGHADQRPIAAASPPEGLARNRRVEIVVRADGKIVPGSANDDPRSLDRLLEALPPLPERADASLRERPPLSPPADLPLP